MTPTLRPGQASTLLLEERFSSGDEKFLEEVLACSSATFLGQFANNWYFDPRPVARATLLRYVDYGCDIPYHRVVVKRLFKLAEVNGDDELIGRFMVAFDGWRKRLLVSRSRWSSSSNVRLEKVLIRDRSIHVRIRPGKKVSKQFIDHKSGSTSGATKSVEFNLDREQIFSLRTRKYLCRRAFRYFRLLAYKDIERYRKAIAAALVLYKDEALDSPEKLLDSWGFVNAIYGASPILYRDPSGAKIIPGRSLKELAPAPLFESAWISGFAELIMLLEKANSRPARVFAKEFLERYHQENLRKLEFARVRSLFYSKSEEASLLGAGLINAHPALPNLPISEWLELCNYENGSPDASALIPDLMKKHVSPNRINLAQCVELACSKLAPIAELGFSWTIEKVDHTVSRDELNLLAKLTSARVPRVRALAADFFCRIVQESSFSHSDHVRDLIDSRFPEVRSRGIDLMLANEKFRDQLSLWAALSESPYDDVRLVLVEYLSKREKELAPLNGPLPIASLDLKLLKNVWLVTLLAIHRGSRSKRKAVDQLAERIVANRADALELLPLLGVALRSIRAPERRHALHAICCAAFKQPELKLAIQKTLPELKLEEVAP